ncbi:MAG: class I SAM-dependent methyltransferase [Acidimicrobiales bacterium]
MDMDEAKWPVLDRAFDDFKDRLTGDEDEDGRLMLAYTMSLHRAWRTVLRMLPVSPTWEVLDVGTGYGVLPMELAAHLPIRVHGIDIVPEYVDGARHVYEALAAQGYFRAGSKLSFEVGDIRRLGCADQSYDFVFVRELLQFLSDPVQAVSELLRVLRPGGYACISDTDDQLWITWPAPSEAFARLHAAVASVQTMTGGDRHTGRKLSSFMRQAGFDVVSTVVLPEAQHHQVDSAEPERALIVSQLEGARARILAAGVMEAAEMDADLAALASEPVAEQFRMNARIVVTGRRPGP